MITIQGPAQDIEHRDRLIDCETSIKPAFQALVRSAEGAGWVDDEIAYAVLGLARTALKDIMRERQEVRSVFEPFEI